jgi:hypothetical protein
MAKLSFVLPFTFREKITDEFPWRKSVNSGAALRLTVLLYSFVRKFAQDDLSAFLIVCPTDQCDRLEALLRPVTRDARYQVTPEDMWIEPILPASPLDTPIGGWYIQQLIKMAASSHVTTPFYVTLDSDIVCTRGFDAHDLLCSASQPEKHLVAVETTQDYARLYNESFADHERTTKNRRYGQSASLLRYERPWEYKDRFYGETPCIINAAKMAELLKYLESSSGSSWHNLLASNPGWTEYALYFQYLEMTNALEATSCLGTCNSVLDLERSVWQHASCYRTDRLYDKDHFLPPDPSMQRGPFIAIQSWLPRNGWLPPKYASIVDFYRDLLSWIY